MAAGSIIVDLIMRTGSFSSDTARATKDAEKRLKEMEKSARELGEQIGGALRTGFIALGAAAVAAAAGFDILVKGAADFKDLEETTGASAESLASFAVAAATAGVEAASIGAAMNMLTKNLVGVDDESKAAGAALKSIGINVADFKKLDPAAQYEAIGKALSGFKDGAGKTAVAIATMGRAGAEQLKVFKAMEEAGGRQVILTQAQIERADAYADAQARSRAILLQYAQVLATDVLPAVTAFTGGLTDAIKEIINLNDKTKSLTGENQIATFAESAVLGLSKVIDFAKTTVQAILLIGGAVGQAITDIRLLNSAAELLNPLSVATGGTDRFLKDLDSRNKGLESFNSQLDRFMTSDTKLVENAVKKQITAAKERDKYLMAFGPGGAVGKPAVDFRGPQKESKAGSERVSEAQRYLDTLEKQYEATLEFTEAEKALAAIQAGRLKGITPQLQEQILAQAQLNDEAKQFEKTRQAQIDNDAKFAKQALANIEALESQNQRIRDEIELFGLEGMALNAAENARISSAIAIKEATLAKMESMGVDEKQFQVLEKEIALLKERQRLNNEKANVEFDSKRQKDEDEAFQKQQEMMRREAEITGRTIETALGDTLELALTGKFDDIEKYFVRMLQRMAIQAAAAQLTKAIQGWGGSSGTDLSGLGGPSGSSGGGWEGWAATIAGWFGGGSYGGGRASGGTVMANVAYTVGEKGPETFVPRTAGTILPTQTNAQRPIQLSQTFVVEGSPPSRQTQSQLAASAYQGVQRGTRDL